MDVTRFGGSCDSGRTSWLVQIPAAGEDHEIHEQPPRQEQQTEDGHHGEGAARVLALLGRGVGFSIHRRLQGCA